MLSPTIADLVQRHGDQQGPEVPTTADLDVPHGNPQHDTLHCRKGDIGRWFNRLQSKVHLPSGKVQKTVIVTLKKLALRNFVMATNSLEQLPIVELRHLHNRAIFRHGDHAP